MVVWVKEVLLSGGGVEEEGFRVEGFVSRGGGASRGIFVARVYRRGVGDRDVWEGGLGEGGAVEWWRG